MGRFTTSVTTEIDAPLERVRAQFADVAHHERTAPHDGVRFVVENDGEDGCDYAQHTAIGPFTATQRFHLDRTVEGPLVNRVTEGLFAGGAITFAFDPTPGGETRVTATVDGAVPRPFAAVVRRLVARSLATALAEDKADIEGGGYPAG